MTVILSALSAYNDIERVWRKTRKSVKAYHEDQAVAAGYCATCGDLRHKGDGHRRRCRNCTKADAAARKRRERAKKEKTA